VTSQRLIYLLKFVKYKPGIADSALRGVGRGTQSLKLMKFRTGTSV
jgi:hypothetical protein